MSCCYDRDFCNEDLKPTLRPTQERPSEFEMTQADLLPRSSGFIAIQRPENL